MAHFVDGATSDVTGLKVSRRMDGHLVLKKQGNEDHRKRHAGLRVHSLDHSDHPRT